MLFGLGHLINAMVYSLGKHDLGQPGLGQQSLVHQALQYDLT